MNTKTYRQLRVLVAFFISVIVSIAVSIDNQVLAVIGVLSGMIFMVLARSKTKIIIDEREKAVREKAAQMTYAIFAPTIGLGSFFLLTWGKSNYYLYELGQIFAYLTLFLITVYAVSYFYLNRQFGGGNEE